MNWLIQKFRNRANQRQLKDHEALKDLRLAFKTRFYAFQLLLRANNSALENMGAIEKALEQKEPFGMPFIKAKTTSVTVDVYRMIRNLKEISPGKYPQLDDRFQEIQHAISQELTDIKSNTDPRFTIPFSEITLAQADLVGNKVAKLADVKNKTAFNVPEGFAITATAYYRFIEANDLQTEINRLFQSVDFGNLEQLRQTSDTISQLIMNATVPDDLIDAIQRATYKLELRIGKPTSYAIRSSAIGEDLSRTSFAGQYKTRLNIKKETIISVYKEIIASMYSLRANIYRYNCGLTDRDNAMCVGVMEMIDAAAGGVVYSVNPLNSDMKDYYIYASWGLPKSVVDGNLPCDQFIVSRDASDFKITPFIADKRQHTGLADDSGIQIKVTDDMTRLQPTISENQIKSITRVTRQLEKHFQVPQDIEWALAHDDKIVILQCRPLKTMKVKQVETNEATVTLPDNTQVILEGGITVCNGSGAGIIHFVDNSTDILGFPQGAVLVTEQALPRWAPLLDKASAIVTGEGSFAGHLANVAREYGVPALFGLGDQINKLKQNAPVTLDATNRVIYEGRIESILTQNKARQNLIEGSPVYQKLKSVSRHIVPLRLLNPESIDFKASKCKTLHDITRFIHEKSISEMFNFGNEYNFLERASKQLVYHVPMQWWILNLDDGYRGEVTSKHVHLEDIQSIPMLALWEGIVAIPWEGPPSLDGRGFMSVMFQATTNNTLTLASRSKMTEKNYFMISKNFCSLSSRLGFHFSSVEAIVGDKIDENYICFQYKGGAADYARKIRRVRFIAEFLEAYGFTTIVKEDSLTARKEKKDQETMKWFLKILGYLIMHSRQLDMVMANEATVRYYQNKFNTDIEKIQKAKPDLC